MRPFRLQQHQPTSYGKTSSATASASPSRPSNASDNTISSWGANGRLRWDMRDMPVWHARLLLGRSASASKAPSIGSAGTVSNFRYDSFATPVAASRLQRVLLSQFPGIPWYPASSSRCRRQRTCDARASVAHNIRLGSDRPLVGQRGSGLAAVLRSARQLRPPGAVRQGDHEALASPTSTSQPARQVTLAVVSGASADPQVSAKPAYHSSPSKHPASRPTQSRSRMREYFTYGSVRGAAGNGGPYRDRGQSPCVIIGLSAILSSVISLLGFRIDANVAKYLR